MNLHVTVNNEPKDFVCQPTDTLLDVLRREGYSGVKVGCSNGDCGICAVLLNGRTVNSCVVLAAHCKDKNIETIEGLSKNDGTLHPLQKAFLDEGGAQCGFCTPGLILSAKELLDDNPTPTEADVKEALSGVICRCTGYVKPIAAVLTAAREIRDAESTTKAA
ncbi:MAG TPA: (2Fe-2S)-binding protein [Verrucomicrobiae bacterium]|nr:(2Fe-2S)-binding protein [Verrucomicrobiae bacterium]